MVKKIINELGDFDELETDFVSECNLPADLDTKTSLDDIEPGIYYTESENTHLIEPPNGRTKSNLSSPYLSEFTKFPKNKASKSDSLLKNSKSPTNAKLSTKCRVAKKAKVPKKLNQSEKKVPKKEYVRCAMIRGHKRALRQIIKSITPSTTINKINSENPKQIQSWIDLSTHFHANSSSLSDIASTAQGPATDGKAKRDNSADRKKAEKSFNDKFCRSYFSSTIVRHSFELYCEVVISEENITLLCEKFKMSCCDGSNHSELCKEKWINFKKYLKYTMIEELIVNHVNSESYEPSYEDDIVHE